MGKTYKDAPDGKRFRVDYSKPVTKRQMRRIDELVQPEFDTGNWEVVEQEIMSDYQLAPRNSK